MRYVPGYKGPTLPGPGPRPAVATTRPMFGSNAADPKPFQPLAPAVATTRPMFGSNAADPKPFRPLAPASVATMMKKGGKVKCMTKGGSASKRADGCAVRGKTKGKVC